MKNTAETIEFFVPSRGLEVGPYIALELPADATPKEARLKKQAIHHLGRYHWAARVLRDSTPGIVLDVACGGGYGSYILATALPDHTIVGADYDPRAVEHAVEHYGTLPNLQYQTLDVVTWVSGSSNQRARSFDYIVSFDTLEHIAHREIALTNFVEFMSPDGALLFSTPCGRDENLLNPGWEHHKIEYSFRYLYNVMRRFFGEVLIPDNGTLPELDFWTEIINKGEQRYFLRYNPMCCRKPIQLGL